MTAERHWQIGSKPTTLKMTHCGRWCRLFQVTLQRESFIIKVSTLWLLWTLCLVHVYTLSMISLYDHLITSAQHIKGRRKKKKRRGWCQITIKHFIRPKPEQCLRNTELYRIWGCCISLHEWFRHIFMVAQLVQHNFAAYRDFIDRKDSSAATSGQMSAVKTKKNKMCVAVKNSKKCFNYCKINSPD